MVEATVLASRKKRNKGMLHVVAIVYFFSFFFFLLLTYQLWLLLQVHEQARIVQRTREQVAGVSLCHIGADARIEMVLLFLVSPVEGHLLSVNFVKRMIPLALPCLEVEVVIVAVTF